MRALLNYDYYYYFADCCCILTNTRTRRRNLSGLFVQSPLTIFNMLLLKTSHVSKFKNKFLFNFNAKHSLGFNLFVDGCSLKSSLLLM